MTVCLDKGGSRGEFRMVDDGYLPVGEANVRTVEWRWAAALALVVASCGGTEAGPADAFGEGTLEEDHGTLPDVEAGTEEDASDAAADTASGEAAAETTEPPGKVRFLHISDLHVYGDAAKPLTGPLSKAVGILNALDFDADFVAATGDYVDFLPDGLKTGDPSTFTACLETLATLRWPVRTMAGNHEYYRSELLDPTGEKAARDAYLHAAMGHGPEESFDLRGVRFLAVNTMQGDQWDASNGLAGSFTDAQLAWIRGRLEDGMPTVLLMHHPPTSGAVTATGDSLCKAIEEHPGTVKAMFAGHLHGFWRGEACGVPYWLVGNTNPDKAFHFEVEVDGATGAVTVMNEADVPFGEIPEFSCGPAATADFDANTLAGTNQVLKIGHMVTNLPGLEGAEGDGLDKAPFVIRFGAVDAMAGQATAVMGQAVPEDGFLVALPGAACVDIGFDVTGACATSREVAFDLDLIPLLRSMLDVTPDASWKARLEVKGFRLEGRLGSVDGGAPGFEEGLVHLSASGLKALDDLRAVLVTEYCAGRIAGCVPGDADMPACPAAADATFFSEVPESCDVTMGTYPLRLVLALLGSYPLDNVSVVGSITTDARPASSTPAQGAVDVAICAD